MFPPIAMLIGWSKYSVETQNVILEGILITSFIYLTNICCVPTTWAEPLDYHSELNRLILSHAVCSVSWGGKSLFRVCFVSATMKSTLLQVPLEGACKPELESV